MVNFHLETSIVHVDSSYLISILKLLEVEFLLGDYPSKIYRNLTKVSSEVLFSRLHTAAGSQHTGRRSLRKLGNSGSPPRRQDTGFHSEFCLDGCRSQVSIACPLRLFPSDSQALFRNPGSWQGLLSPSAGVGVGVREPALWECEKEPIRLPRATVCSSAGFLLLWFFPPPGGEQHREQNGNQQATLFHQGNLMEMGAQSPSPFSRISEAGDVCSLFSKGRPHHGSRTSGKQVAPR